MESKTIKDEIVITNNYDDYTEDSIVKINRQNTALVSRTRDLLPKLISGEVDVEKLDINIPAEAA